MAGDLVFIEPDENLSAAFTVYNRCQQFDVRNAGSADAAEEYLQKPVKSIALDKSLQHARHLRLARKFFRHARQLEDLHEAHNLNHQLFDEVPCSTPIQI